MSDVKMAYDQIVDFLSDTKDKTLLLSGFADKEKHQSLIRALNTQGGMKGLVLLIHTSIDGIKNFFRWAEMYDLKVPKKYGEAMKLSNITFYFDNLTTKSSFEKYDNYAFDFIIIWPIQSVTENENEIRQLREMTKRQNTKKIIFLTIKEPWYNPDSFKSFVDRVIELNCENDDPAEYQRIQETFSEDMKRRQY